MRPLLCLFSLLTSGVSLVLASRPVNVTEGYVNFEVPSINRTCQTYYKIIGNLRPGVRPLIALHGGPGVSSEYLEILSDVTNGRPGPLIVYDQIGTGLSTHLQETAGNTSFWVVDLFIDELKNLLSNLNIKEYDLIGQSWGGMLGSSFAIQRPKGLRHLILFSSPASMDLWIEAQIALKDRFPTKLRDALDKYEEDHVVTPEYEEAMAYYNSHHLCTLDPWPLPIIHSAEWGARDPTVGNTMYGPSQFKVTGSLAGWSVINDLPKINVPTLVTNGAQDGAQDIVVLPFVRRIPQVKWVKFLNSSHMAHFEERGKFMRTVSKFLYH